MPNKISPFGYNGVNFPLVISSVAQRSEKSQTKVLKFLLKSFCLLAFFMSLWQYSNAQVRKNIPLNNHWETVLLDNASYNKSDEKNLKFKTINIPHNWDDYYGYRRLIHGNLHASALYKKIFTINKLAGKKYFLFFEGVGSYATVWVNDKNVGYHAGGRTSFTLDITGALLNGKNTIKVKADHPANIQNLPWVCGGCSDERGFSEGSQPLGIFRPVTLVETNQIKITPFGVHAWAAVQPNSTLLNIDATVKNYSQTDKSIILVQQLLNKENKITFTLENKYQIKANDSLTFSQRDIAVNHPVLWSVENPYLYKIKTIVKEGKIIVDELVTDFGFRTVEWKTKTNQFLLNGKPVFINGVAEYEHLIGQSHAFSDEQILSRIKWIEAAGFNAFRDGHQPHHLLYGKYFNERGILWWTQLSAHVWSDTPEFRNNFKTLLREWVIERRNDPAVIMWGLQNESKLPKEFAEECTQLIRSLDPTASTQRPVTTCNGGEGTDWDVPQNWTGTYGGNPDTYGDDLKKQILVGEYGAWRTLDLHTEGGFVQNGPLSEDRFTLLMEKKVRLAESVKDSVAGHYFWLLTSHDNPGRVQGGEGYRELDRIGPVNYKGMLTPWEEPTDVFYMFRSNYVSAQKEPMVYIASHTWPNRWTTPGIKDSVIVYSNCDEVELFNDVDGHSLGKQKRNGIGTHFQWNKINVQYNVLYAVGYVNGKAVANDTVTLLHLPQSPNFKRLFADAKNITKPQAKLKYLYRINCGGPDYKDVNGNIWQADINKITVHKGDNFVLMKFPGSSSWASNFPEMPATFASQRRTFVPINGTKDWKLFQTFRYGRHLLNYQFPLPNGEYIVEMYFAEPWLGIGGGMNASGMRVFDVAVNGKTVLKDFDIWKEVGTNHALKKMVTVNVTNGQLVIDFPETQSGQAIISAIAIASKSKNSKPNPTVSLIYDLKCDGCTIQSWSDIGDKPFFNELTQISQLPSNLFGADWVQFNKKEKTDLSFRTIFESDVFIAVQKSSKAYKIEDFEHTGSTVVTDDNGGTAYEVYRRRVQSNSKVGIQLDAPILVFLQPANNMQPAFDLKPTTSYKAAVAIMSDGVALEMIANNNRSVVKTANPVQIEWPVKTGVADIYSFTVKYNWPSADDLEGTLELFDAGGNRMLVEKINFKFTRDGKWNFVTVNTGSQINAGNYNVKLTTKNAKGLIVSNVDVQ
ncbi:MAG: malectin domain-containing carbohydrate-binding protein [Niabella sp.]